MAVYFDDSYNPSSKKFTLLVLYLKNYDVNELKKLFNDLNNIIRSWKNSPRFNDKKYSDALKEIKTATIKAINDKEITNEIKKEVKGFLLKNNCIYEKIIEENIDSNKQKRTYKKLIIQTIFDTKYNTSEKFYFDKIDKQTDKNFKKTIHSSEWTIDSQNTTKDEIKYELMLTDLINLII